MKFIRRDFNLMRSSDERSFSHGIFQRFYGTVPCAKKKKGYGENTSVYVRRS